MGVIYIIVFIIGVLVGIWIRSHIITDRKAIGVVQIDHNTGLCRFVVERDDLSNKKCNKAVFNIEHNAIIKNDDDSQ